jgi:hypothetical protein
MGLTDDAQGLPVVLPEDVKIIEKIGAKVGAEVPLASCKVVLFGGGSIPRDMYLLGKETAQLCLNFRREKLGEKFAKALGLAEAVSEHFGFHKRMSEGRDRYEALCLERFGHGSPWLDLEQFASKDVTELTDCFGKSLSEAAVEAFRKFRSDYDQAYDAAIKAAAPADFVAYLAAKKKFDAEWTGKEPATTEKDGDESETVRRRKPYLKGVVACYRSFGKSDDGTPRTFYMLVPDGDQPVIDAVHASMDPPKSVKFGSPYDIHLGAAWLLAEKKRRDEAGASTKDAAFAAFASLLAGVKAEDTEVPFVAKNEGRRGKAFTRQNGGKGRRQGTHGVPEGGRRDARDEE